MMSMKVDDKYRILLDGERLPVEIDQTVVDEQIARLKNAADALQTILQEIYDGDNTIYSIVSSVMSSSCVDYHDGKVWHLDNLVYELEQLQKQLEANEDVVPSYEEVETIFDHGFRDCWINSNIYGKVLEDTDEREVVEEVFFHNGELVHRKRTTNWEMHGYSKSSTSIVYEDLPVDDNFLRIVMNSKKQMGEVR